MDIRRLNVDKKDLTEFFKFPSLIYQNNSSWIPPIVIEELNKLLDPKSLEQRNDFAYFMVYENSKPLARIAAGIEKSLNEKNKLHRGYISYYECVKKVEASNLALSTAISYLKEKGATEVIATKETSFSSYGKGILVNGFNDSNGPIYPYNHPYYSDFIKSFGFKPYKHHDTYWIDSSVFPYDYLNQLTEKAMHRFKFRTESISLHADNVTQVAEKLISVIHQCYNSDWEIPQPSLNDIEYELKTALKYSSSNYIVLAYSDERIIGALMGYADFNVKLKSYNGKLFPRYYWDKFFSSYQPQIAHCNMIFVVPDFQYKAVDIALICKAFILSQLENIKLYEATTIPAMNKPFTSTIKKLGGIKARTYGQYLLSI